MSDEQFSFFPRPYPEKDEGYTTKELDFWTWKDFQNYFDDSYQQKLGMKPPGLPFTEFPKRKTMLESSINYWGRPLLKSMIDFLIERGSTLKVDTIGINLVCGKHYWANEIAQRTQRLEKHRLEFEREEE